MARFRREKKIEAIAGSRKRMKKFDLDSELKAMSVPERGQEFWDSFPERVLDELRSTPPAPSGRLIPVPWLAWGLGTALACLAALLCLGHSRLGKTACYALLKDERK